MSLRTFSFWFSWHTHANCFIFSAGLLTASLIIDGDLSMFFAKSSILPGMVAENMIVWQFDGNSLAIDNMSSWNPMSSMRSASSKTKNDTLLRSTLPIVMWLIRRPGVAMMMSAPIFMLLYSWS